MREPEYQDETIMLLRSLPEIDLDKRRAREIRDRARIILSRRSGPAPSLLIAIERFYSKMLEPVLVTGLTAAFLVWIGTRCFEVFSRFPDGIF